MVSGDDILPYLDNITSQLHNEIFHLLISFPSLGRIRCFRNYIICTLSGINLIEAHSYHVECSVLVAGI